MRESGFHVHEENDCTYVYYGCGSCGDGLALVEVYCSSTGGPQPDGQWCEVC